MLILLIWLAWTPRDTAGLALSAPLRGSIFLGFYALLIVALGIWSRIKAATAYRQGTTYALHRFSRLFNRIRLLVVAWFAFGVFVLDWQRLIGPLVDRCMRWGVETPQMIVGVLPPVLTWILLWWAQYPVERALRERRAMLNANTAMPVFIPPTMGEYLRDNIRTHVLFTLAPIVAVFALRDAAVVLLPSAGIVPSPAWEASLSLLAAVAVLLGSPILLARILPTQPLPASPLRVRLDAFCRRRRLRFADIRLWRTHGMVANAAVMGILPPVRYLIVSDLIVESMPDEQVEAIFGHEAGHVVHHHLLWLGLTLTTYMLAITALGDVVMPHVQLLGGIGDLPQGLVSIVIGLPLFWFVFGLVSRQFERQADIFSARIMQQRHDAPDDDLAEPSRRLQDTHVGPDGASITAAALDRIAQINDINPAAHEWLHGSIDSRMAFLRSMCEEPGRTARFDQHMRRLYITIAVLAAGFAGWTLWQSMQP